MSVAALDAAVEVARAVPLARELPDVGHQLPDFLVGELAERFRGRHAGARRSIANDPEELTIGNFFHDFLAGEITRRRIKLR